MRFPILALAFALAAKTLPASAQDTRLAAPLTVQEAMRLADTAAPAIRARQAQLEAVEGLRREAAPPLFNNPAITLEGTRRRADNQDGRGNEWNVGVAQPIEVGGQQTRRREAAAAGLEALRAEIDDARRQARADTAVRFYAVLAAQRRVDIERRSAEIFESVAQTVSKRRAAGEDTRLDDNVARIEAERARNALAVARERLQDARNELATTLQWPPASLPEVAGDLGTRLSGTPPYGLDQLLASARLLPRQRALAAREEAARARLAVERGHRYPDLTVGLSVGREGFRDSREHLTTLSLSMPLPLFKRNDAAIGQALSEMTQAELERITATREAQAQVHRLWSRLESQRERVQRLQRTMMPASTDNQQLTVKSRQAGQIGLLEQLTVNRQALEAERDLNDALSEFNATSIELEYSAAWSQEGSSR